MNMAVYERGNKCVKTMNFTNGASLNLEPAFAFMGENEDYADVAEAINKLCPMAIGNFVKMIFLLSFLMSLY